MDPLETLDLKSEVVEMLAVNKMAGKEVTVQPVDMTNYVWQEEYLAIEQMVNTS